MTSQRAWNGQYSWRWQDWDHCSQKMTSSFIFFLTYMPSCSRVWIGSWLFPFLPTQAVEIPFNIIAILPLSFYTVILKSWIKINLMLYDLMLGSFQPDVHSNQKHKANDRHVPFIMFHSCLLHDKFNWICTNSNIINKSSTVVPIQTLHCNDGQTLVVCLPNMYQMYS